MRSWSAKTPVKRSRAFAALAFTVVFFAACSSNKRNEVLAAPNFELKDLSGDTVRLESFKGHPVLLDFWATWCGPCRMSIPMVQAFYAKHKDEGLVVLGMNMDDDPSGVYGFVKHFKMTYPVLFAANSSAPGDYEVQGIPRFVFIGPDGRIMQNYEGFSYDMVQDWEAVWQKALKKSQ